MAPKHKLFLVISMTLGVFTFHKCVLASTYGSGSFGTSEYSPAEPSVVDSTNCTKNKPNGKVTITSVTPELNKLTVNFTGGLEPFNQYEIKWGYTKDLSESYLGDKAFGNESSKNYVISNLKPSTEYFIKVRAINYCNGGKWSDTVSARTVEKSNINNAVASQIQYEAISKNTSTTISETVPVSALTLIVTVVNSKNESLPNVPVTLKEFVKTQNTNDKGEAHFFGVPYGNYTLQIDYEGLQTVQTLYLNDYSAKEVKITIQIPDKQPTPPNLDSSKPTQKAIVIGVGVLLTTSAVIFVRKKFLKN